MAYCKGRDSKTWGDWNVRVDLSFKAYSPTLKSLESILFITTVKNKFVRGDPASFKSSVITLFCRPDVSRD